MGILERIHAPDNFGMDVFLPYLLFSSYDGHVFYFLSLLSLHLTLTMDLMMTFRCD
jgi:hypothetical protein